MMITTAEIEKTERADPREVIRELGPDFAARAAENDENDRFVADNYEALKQAKLFSAMVPVELGGGGVSHSEMCRLIVELASYCASTALAFSMHQHLVAAAVWNYRHGKPGEKLLRKVADGETVLVSTGAKDWLHSSGTLVSAEGGFKFSGKKIFASGSPAGELLITSARYDDPELGPRVLHFALPMNTPGVSIEPVWRAMGMRATGSHNVVIENAFVPAETIVLSRPRGEYHPVWNVILTVAMPLICSAYGGVAEAAASKARRSAAKRGDDSITPLLVGEMENEVVTARIGIDSMIGIANDLDFEPTIESANDMLIRKTIVTQAVIRAAEKALEVTGGGGFFRGMGLERLVRDAHAGQFHPLPPKPQQRFTGRLAMGLDPVEE